MRISVTPAASQTCAFIGTGIISTGHGSAGPAPRIIRPADPPPMPTGKIDLDQSVAVWGLLVFPVDLGHNLDRQKTGRVRSAVGLSRCKARVTQPRENQVGIHRIPPRLCRTNHLMAELPLLADRPVTEAAGWLCPGKGKIRLSPDLCNRASCRRCRSFAADPPEWREGRFGTEPQPFGIRQSLSVRS